MGAIDLLFDVKRDSERLHQLVLGALLSRTALVDRLVPLPAAPDSGPGQAPGLALGQAKGLGSPAVGAAPSVRPLHFDPVGKAFDLAIGPVGAGSEGGRGTGRILVEVKLDAPISEDHLAQQLSPARLHDGDRLLCLLLGYSAVTTDRAALRDRIRRIGEHTGRPDLIDRVSLRDARDLVPLLADPTLLPQPHDAHHRDARDLAAAYRDALIGLSQRLTGYAARPISSWSDGDFIGFYAACRERRIGALSQARIGRIATSDGNVLGCAFAAHTVCGGQAQLDLAFQGAQLCIRLHPQPGATESRRSLRQIAHAALLAQGALAPDGPLRWVEAPARLTAVMTLLSCDELLSGARSNVDLADVDLPNVDLADGAKLRVALGAAEELLRKVAAQLGT